MRASEVCVNQGVGVHTYVSFQNLDVRERPNISEREKKVDNYTFFITKGIYECPLPRIKAKGAKKIYDTFQTYYWGHYKKLSSHLLKSMRRGAQKRRKMAVKTIRSWKYIDVT